MKAVKVFLAIIAFAVSLLAYQLVIVPTLAERSARIEAARIKTDREQRAIDFAKEDAIVKRWAKSEGYGNPTIVAVDSMEEATKEGIDLRAESNSSSFERFNAWQGEKQLLVLKDPKSKSSVKAYVIFLIINDKGEMHRV